MAQHLLLAFFRVVVSTFFRRVEVVGQEHVPADGPVIFAANHPNALMDGLVLVMTCGRTPVHFMCNAKLWRYPILSWMLNRLGGVPVRRVEEHAGPVNNEAAFERLFASLETGVSVGIFPEGVSHTGSQLTRLKTGAARIALGVVARGKVRVTIVPCGLTYVHRHRFRSQALVHYGQPIAIDDGWASCHAHDPAGTVTRLTEELRGALTAVTLNAPDWDTLRAAHAARRLYKPAGVTLTPAAYVELSRRFVERYLATAHEPEMRALRDDIERYQDRLDALGIKDHQLRNPVSRAAALRRLAWRGARFVALLPLGVPGALIHMPVAWLAATAGHRLAEDTDDVATLKVMTVVLMLPLVYAGLALATGWSVSTMWGIALGVALPASFFASLKVLEGQARLLTSLRALARSARRGDEFEALRQERERLVERVRAAADHYADPTVARLFPGSR
jgi:glycerol-3-phosphate O-acyltransferase / dihydroxyacetone phosphate acyltransferase